MARTYKDNVFSSAKLKMDEIMKRLPKLCCTYLIGARDSEPTTRLNYARKLDMFFTYLVAAKYDNTDPSTLSDEAVMAVTLDDIEGFIREVELHPSRSSKKNAPEGYGASVCGNTVNNYMSALSAFYEYLVETGRLTTNIVKSVRRAKRAAHDIEYLEYEDTLSLIDSIWEGDGLSERIRAYRNKHDTAIRDACILKILCNTGIRVSELVGLDVNDYDTKHSCLHIIRKGDHEDRVYMSDETKMILEGYIENRDVYSPVEGENALFLVSIGKYKGRRLSVRSVEKLVHKYVDTMKLFHGNRISAHKLRSTFAMNLLEKTGDISLAQERLGHKNIATTAIYAKALAKTVEESRNIL